MATTWDDTASDYVASFGRLCAGATAATVAALGPPGDDPLLLDVGTGPGTIAEHAAASGFEPHGVDNEPSMIDRARSAHPEIPFDLGRLPRLPYPDSSFAAVTAGFVINHVPEPSAAVAELERVARPGAPVAITVWPSGISPLNAFWNELLDRADAVRSTPPRLPPEQDFERSPVGLTGLLTSGGLVVVNSREIRWTFSIAPADLWRAVAGGIATVGQAYRAQDPAGRNRVRATYDLMAAERAVDGRLDFRATAILGVGRAA